MRGVPIAGRFKEEQYRCKPSVISETEPAFTDEAEAKADVEQSIPRLGTAFDQNGRYDPDSDKAD